jgi:hypothetical protein
MITTLFGLLLALTPFVLLAVLLRVAERLQQRRLECYVRQIELTDAIHRELGAVAAPTVRRRRDGRWLISMTVPFDRPAVVAAILRVTDQMFGSDGAAGDASYAVVLARRNIERSETGGFHRSTLNRQARAAA